MSGFRLVALVALLASCGEEKCSEEDLDGDGIVGCDEWDLGTDPDLADSDGDGVSDGEEVGCVSDPLDVDEQCYACGWGHHDPGTLESTGAALGDVIADFSLFDQCGESVDVWDFYGEYHIMFLTAAW